MIEAAELKRQTLDLGFSACGIARAERVDAKTEQGLRKWLSDGMNAGMDYMDNYLDMRLDPRLIMPGLKTIISVALNYAPAQTMPKDQPQMASYALGQDYHTVMRDKLLLLAARIMPEEVRFNGKKPIPSPHYRVFVDSGPVLERYWAVKAGLGWMGKNHQLIIPHGGSMFFLGELFLDIELPPDDPMPNHCGICRRCIDACPTHALLESGEFNADRCLSYQTIENKGELSEEAQSAMGNCFYGCDRCQQACPWNRFAKPNTTPELQPKEELLEMTLDKWRQLSVEDYRRLFKGSAVKRAKYEGLMRNIRHLKQE